MVVEPAPTSLSEATALQRLQEATARARVRDRVAKWPVLSQFFANGEILPDISPPTYNPSPDILTHPSPDILTDAAAQKACDELMTFLENGGWDFAPEPLD